MMNKRYYTLLLALFLYSTCAFAQNNNHVGEWKLTLQRVTAADGRIYQGDSTNLLQRKIMTAQNQFIVVGERITDGVRLASSVHGGYYSLKGTDYTETLQYAAYPGFEKWKCNFKMTIDGDVMHQVGTLEDGAGVKTTYDEIYVRVKPPVDPK
jgi:hypothetical protein